MIMLKPINIQKTALSPKVVLDKENNTFFILGKSITVNAYEFYLPIEKWFEEYFKNPNKLTQLFIYLEYLNSASLLQIKIIMSILNNNKENCEIKVVWLYDEDDEGMQETGKEFQYSTYLNFEIKEIGNDDIDNIEDIIINYGKS